MQVIGMVCNSSVHFSIENCIVVNFGMALKTALSFLVGVSVPITNLCLKVTWMEWLAKSFHIKQTRKFAGLRTCMWIGETIGIVFLMVKLFTVI